jgi:hypothetical protein
MQPGDDKEAAREEHMTITGGCRCGAVRYRVEAEPLFTRHCW